MSTLPTRNLTGAKNALTRRAHFKKIISGVLLAGFSTYTQSALSQSAVVTNNANPSAAVSTNTTGGTNINYQTNNQWSNEMGFAPGIFCRTPTFYIGGGSGQNIGNTSDTLNNGSYQYTHNYNANMGLLIPFGSSVQRDCKRLAEQIAEDREISSDLSMIRACASLDNEGIIVDPSKFPTLSRCVIRPGQPPLTVARAKAMQSLQQEQSKQNRQLMQNRSKEEIIKN
jgi:hypothetical protein